MTARADGARARRGAGGPVWLGLWCALHEAQAGGCNRKHDRGAGGGRDPEARSGVFEGQCDSNVRQTKRGPREAAGEREAWIGWESDERRKRNDSEEREDAAV